MSPWAPYDCMHTVRERSRFRQFGVAAFDSLLSRDGMGVRHERIFDSPPLPIGRRIQPTSILHKIYFRRTGGSQTQGMAFFTSVKPGVSLGLLFSFSSSQIARKEKEKKLFLMTFTCMLISSSQ